MPNEQSIMYDANVEGILRCGQCKKPFDKQSTLKRHLYYCRSRHRAPVSRSRSCLTCAKQKARCDNLQPECSRCVSKSRSCQYPIKTSTTTASKPHHVKGYPLRQSETTTPSSSGQSSPDQYELTSSSDNALAIKEPHFINFEEHDFTWDASFMDFVDTLDTLSTDAVDKLFPVPQESLWPSALTLQPPSRPSRSMLARTYSKPNTTRAATLIHHLLKSYLLTLQRSEYPPFIHPYIMRTRSGDMEFLTNCISLVRMIGNDKSSRRLFWRNVQMECERLLAERAHLNKWELLAAMQAQSIYVLLRIDEGRADDNDLDAVLIDAILATIQQLQGLIMAAPAQGVAHSNDSRADWEEWLFGESSRRLALVYQVVNLLFYFEPALMCERPSNIVLATLPAAKSLWEAKDELTWAVHMAKEPHPPRYFGLIANGDLIKLGPDATCGADAVAVQRALRTGVQENNVASWEEWCSGMDDLGALVMLAASSL